MVWPVGFLRFGEGTHATYGPGSRRILKFQWNLKVLKLVKILRKMKVLGSVAGRRRKFPQGEETARPGSNIVENVRFGLPGALPRTLARGNAMHASHRHPCPGARGGACSGASSS